ncbi:hypothetical protein D9758_000517 [Tetrapyrgos nigripes]|uniref:BHLH domain-containing protein n=1 Tax=Tetrapyrgos nigripes TaxID=182062 RepID=A0A8H5H1X7_9AGAR|nr:hypothetical protein D9758_000517 [Tetrapyrgos nigripes]
MWCDNCLLVLPLVLLKRGGAIAWGVVLAAYSLAGGLFLLIDGQYLFFFYPEWQIYGGIGVGVCALSVIGIFALSNRSYIWTRVCKFLWPFIIVICGIRAILMIVELQRGKDKIIWECNNGGQVWSDDATTTATTTDSSTTFPAGFCAAGFSSINAAFIVSLLVDLVFQYPPSPSSPNFSSMNLNPSASPMSFHPISMPNVQPEYGYAPTAFTSPSRPYTPADGASISPPMLSYSLSNPGDASSDEHSTHTRTPPPSVPYAATVPRSHRYNPIAAPPTRVSARAAVARGRRNSTSNSKSQNEDSDDEDAPVSSGGVDQRREAVRRQRIESEQKRRDDLRDGYSRLKSTLPSINQKSSKIVLLERAASHIKYLDAVKNRLEAQLKVAEDEVNRLRNVNEVLMIGTANQRLHAVANSGMQVQSSF